jgi:hypothetical protein
VTPDAGALTPPASLPKTCDGKATKVDILFVIDNSNSMAEKQQQLAQQFSHMYTTLIAGQHDLHIGIVTSDLGVPFYSLPT